MSGENGDYGSWADEIEDTVVELEPAPTPPPYTPPNLINVPQRNLRGVVGLTRPLEDTQTEEVERVNGSAPKLVRHDRHGRKVPADPAQDKAMQRFYDEIDLEKLELFMGESDKYTSFIDALNDPAYSSLKFSTVCRKFGVTLHELQTLYTDGMRHLSLLRMSNALPKIASDVAEDAQSHWVVCPTCTGTMRVIEPVEDRETGRIIKTVEKDCPHCDHTGKVRVIGDKHARDLVFESMKLKGVKGPLVAVQNNFGGNGTADGLDARMEGMLKLTQNITVGGGGENQ